MSDVLVKELKNGPAINPDDNVFNSIWDEYERVIVKSLISSFGLDFIVNDQYGGDVDTILNVNKIGIDPNMKYKNKKNEQDYNNRGVYDNVEYHKDDRYREIVQKARKEFNEEGKWQNDTYVKGNKVAPNKSVPYKNQGQLDHVVSAKEVHDDRGRVLAGLDGKELANSTSNLRYTNAALNNNMRDKSIEEYIKWCEDNPEKVNFNGNKGEPLPEDIKRRLRAEYERAKKEMIIKEQRAYYTSSKFAKDTAKAAGKRGVQMGVRQALGFVFAEIWFAVKIELNNIDSDHDMQDSLEAVGRGINKGVKNAQNNNKELISNIEEGFVAGALSSLTTTLCNIFFTTAKNLVKCIRQLYASVIQAGRVLLFNPDNLMLGDRIKTATIIIATGANVLTGTIVGEMVSKTPIGAMPVVGNIVQVFCSTLVSGILSCTLLVFLDRSKLMNLIINSLNDIPTEVNNYREIADMFERLAARFANIDIEKFRKDTEQYKDIAIQIDKAESDDELNNVLYCAYKKFNIKIPWEGDFDTFMSDRSNHLVFE